MAEIPVIFRLNLMGGIVIFNPEYLRTLENTILMKPLGQRMIEPLDIGTFGNLLGALIWQCSPGAKFVNGR